MTDQNFNFAEALQDEDTLIDGISSGGGFSFNPPAAGVALFRLREIIEFGAEYAEYQGKPKKNPNRPIRLVFELVHSRHAIHKKAENDPEGGPYTGDLDRKSVV